jgi:hypothetical protein
MESIDPEMEELKELVKRQSAKIEDTNRIVHKLLRSQRWDRLFRLVWWLAILGVTGAAYYYYVQPYLDQLLALYGQAEGFGDQFREFFQSFRPGQ